MTPAKRSAVLDAIREELAVAASRPAGEEFDPDFREAWAQLEEFIATGNEHSLDFAVARLRTLDATLQWSEWDRLVRVAARTARAVAVALLTA